MLFFIFKNTCEVESKFCVCKELRVAVLTIIIIIRYFFLSGSGHDQHLHMVLHFHVFYIFNKENQYNFPCNFLVTLCVSLIVLYNSALCKELESDPDMLSSKEGANTDQPLPHMNFASEGELVKLGEASNSTKLALNFSLWKKISRQPSTGYRIAQNFRWSKFS